MRIRCCVCVCLPAGVLYDGRCSLGRATECRRVYMNMFRLSGFELKARVCVMYDWVGGGVLRVFGWFGYQEWFVSKNECVLVVIRYYYEDSTD